MTAWPVGGTEHALQEHRLLSHVLQLLSHYPTLPTEFLRGSLKDRSPLPMITARADALKEPAEFWTAIGSNCARRSA